MNTLFNRSVLFVAPSQSCSGFATLGRPVSLPLGKQPHHRSSSDPDLPGSNPGSPDAEVAGIIGMYNHTLTYSPCRAAAWTHLIYRSLESLVHTPTSSPSSTPPPGQQPRLIRCKGCQNHWYVHPHPHHLPYQQHLSGRNPGMWPVQYTPSLRAFLSVDAVHNSHA